MEGFGQRVLKREENKVSEDGSRSDLTRKAAGLLTKDRRKEKSVQGSKGNPSPFCPS
jgi:hypothetical protein